MTFNIKGPLAARIQDQCDNVDAQMIRELSAWTEMQVVVCFENNEMRINVIKCINV